MSGQPGEGVLRVGVVGVGHLGTIHARLWKAIDGADLVGVLDARSDRAALVASDLGVSQFEDLPSMLAQVDAIGIVTTTSSHAAIAQQSLDAGVHCFIEKPITARYAEALPLIECARERGLVIQVGHVERFNAATLALEGRDVAPMFIEAHRMAQFQSRATDVAVVLDLMIHDIDLAIHLVASPVVEIRASGVSVISDTIDIANARLEFENGCVANLTASRISQRPMRKMRLFQQDAYISMDFAAPSVEIFRIGEGASEGNEPTMLLGRIEEGTRNRSISYVRPELGAVNAIERELRAFVDSIARGVRPPVTAEEGAEALRVAEEVIDAIDRSAHAHAGTGRRD